MTYIVDVKLEIEAHTQSEALSEVEKRLRAGTSRPAEDPFGLAIKETNIKTAKGR